VGMGGVGGGCWGGGWCGWGEGGGLGLWFFFVYLISLFVIIVWCGLCFLFVVVWFRPLCVLFWFFVLGGLFLVLSPSGCFSCFCSFFRLFFVGVVVCVRLLFPLCVLWVVYFFSNPILFLCCFTGKYSGECYPWAGGACPGNENAEGVCGEPPFLTFVVDGVWCSNELGKLRGR